MSRFVALLTAQELTDALKSTNGVIIPIASMEQCGLHGATGIDVKVADHVAPLLAQKCNMLVAPTVPYGDTLEMSSYPGTVHVPTEYLGNLYLSIASSYFASGARNVVFLATHSLNTRAADHACRILYSAKRNAMFVDFWKACSQISKDILADKVYGTGHGAEQISSVAMAVCPDLIRKDKAANEAPKAALAKKVAHIYGSANVCTAYGNFDDYSTTGSWGDISAASAEKGSLIIEKAVKLMASSVLDVLEA